MDPDLIARYAAQRLPRYTSYPTAPHFTPAVDGAAFAGWLGALPADQDLSLYLHVPFCAELCLYCGCHTRVARRYEPVAAYVELLAREIDLVAAQLGAGRRVTHIHWGGGTPTILRGSDLARVNALLRARFDLALAAEIAVEVDPRTITPAHVEALAQAGLTRASLGVQSLDPLVQRTIRRVQSMEETRRVAEWLRFAGVEGLNIDLMYGLPHQSVANVLATVEAALDLDPDRVSLFGYAHVPWLKRHQELLPEDALPDGAARAAQFEAAADRLLAAGYVRIGLDHFAKPEDTLVVALEAGRLRRNFQGYTTDTAPALVGLGASAISALPQGYAQNAADVPAYRRRIEAGALATARGIALSPEDRLRRDVIERLMCDLSVDLDEVCRSHGRSACHFDTELARIDALAGDGIARRSGTRIEVPDEVRDLVRVVGAVFDAHAGPNVAMPSRII